MVRDLKLLFRLRLLGMFGINQAKYSRDKSKRRGLYGMIAVYAFLMVMGIGYSTALAASAVALGIGDLIPAMFGFAVCAIILFTVLIRTGSEIFGGTCDKLRSLPLNKSSIPLSRVLMMYFENLLISAVILIPATVVYAVNLGGGFGVVRMLIGIFLLPMLPISVSALLGILVYTLGARLRRRNFWITLLSLIFVVAVIAFPMFWSGNGIGEGELADMARGAIERITKVIVPIGWFAGNAGDFLIFTGTSVAAFAFAAWFVCRIFYKVIDGIRPIGGKRAYKLSEKRRGVFDSLLSRELKLYFSSSIYVTNTIIAPIMAVIAAVSFAVVGQGKLSLPSEAQVPERIITLLLPFVLSIVLSLSSTTASAISMEGKNRWIVQSLPIQTSDVIKAKLAVNLIIGLPGWVISEAIIMIFAAPKGLNLLWTLLLPLIYLVFSTAAGLTINLAFRFYDWENAQQAVKQSKAVGFSLLASTAAVAAGVGIAAGGYFALGEAGMNVSLGAVAILMTAVALLLFRKAEKADLRDNF